MFVGVTLDDIDITSRQHSTLSVGCEKAYLAGRACRDYGHSICAAANAVVNGWILQYCCHCCVCIYLFGVWCVSGVINHFASITFMEVSVSEQTMQSDVIIQYSLNALCCVACTNSLHQNLLTCGFGIFIFYFFY